MEIEGFLTYLETEKRSSPNTISAYRNDLEQFSTFCTRQFEISDSTDVNQTIVRSWLAELMEEKYQAASVHRKLSSVNAYYKFLMKTGKSEANPARALAKPKLPQRLPVFVDERSAAMLYQLHTNQDVHPKQSENKSNVFLENRNQLIVTLFYETGIRREELLNLREADVDFYIGQIKVLGKRNKMRYVPIGKGMIEKIRQYILVRNSFKINLTTENLFVTEQGNKISKTLVYLTVKSYLSQVTTIKRKSPHILRHTFATHMLNNGADLNVIKEILGHSSLAATQVYTHNSIEKLKNIHNRMHPRNN